MWILVIEEGAEAFGPFETREKAIEFARNRFKGVAGPDLEDDEVFLELLSDLDLGWVTDLTPA